jgi:hypothetical protein
VGLSAEILAEEMDLLPCDMAGEGRVAALAETGKEEALNADGAGGCLVEAASEVSRLLRPALESDGSLASCGHHAVDPDILEHQAGPIFDAQSIQPRASQEGCVGLALGNLAEPGVNIPAQLSPFGPGEEQGALGASTRATRGDESRGRYRFPAYQHVARILARKEAGNGQPTRHLGGEVLSTVNSEVALATK